MATILTKRSNTASSVPVAGDLTNSTGGAELAVNTADKRLFTKDSGGTVVELGTNPSSVTLPNGTANGVPYLNGSKVLTSGSALTFNGTNFGIGSTAPTYRLTVVGAQNSTVAAFNDSSAGEAARNLMFTSSSNGLYWTINSQGSSGLGQLAFAVNSSEGMRLTSTGLGIGTSSPQVKFVVSNSGANGYEFDPAAGYISAYNRSTSAWTKITTRASSYTFNISNSIDALNIDSSGNLGLGVTPSAMNTITAMQLGSTAIIAGQQSGAEALYLGSNWYYNSGWKYKQNGYASRYGQDSGQHTWYTAPSGTAGNAISFTQAMTLDASGNLGVGTTSPSNKLEVNGAARFYTAAQGDVSITHSGLISSITAAGSIGLAFGTNNTERARIDSSGNLLVGTTSAEAKFQVKSPVDAATIIRGDGDTTGYYGSVFVANSARGATTGFNLYDGYANGNLVFRVYGNGNVINSNNSYGAISDAKLKENVADATPKLDKLNQVRVVNYNLIGQEQKQLGVIAQELEQIFPGMIEEAVDRDQEGNDLGTTTKSVKYSVFVPMLIKAIQEQQAIINDLKARLDAANL